MSDRDDRSLTALVRRCPRAQQVARITNNVLTVLGYVAYPLLIVLLFLFDPDLLVRALVVPAISFVLLSAFRYLYDAPRPFELYDINTFASKNMKGHSFPSRHCFSMAMIASTWLVWQPLVGIFLWICALLLACVRVICGLHWPRDVICGELFALACAAVGYLLIF